MHPLVEKFLERPMSHKIGVAAVTILIAGAMAWQYVLAPGYQQIDELTQKRASLTLDITKSQKIAHNLPQYQQEVKDLESRLKVALQELPDEKDIPDLLKSIADLAKESGLEVELFKPEQEEKRDFFAEVPVSMTVDGSFHQIATFFDEVGHMPRVVNIRGINISNPHVTDKGLIVKADCKAVTFRYLPEAERVQQQQESSDKKRHRK